MSTAAALAMALGLSACAGGKPKGTDIVLVTPEATAAPPPSSCNPKNDPKWTPMPRRALTRSDIVTNDDANGRAFDRVAGKRAGCWRELKAARG